MTEARHAHLVGSIAALLAASLAAPRGAAASDVEQRSRQLFKQGGELANDGRWAEACPLFQAAHDLHATGGTALRTADCYEKIARYERALDLYQYVVDHREGDRTPDRVKL